MIFFKFLLCPLFIFDFINLDTASWPFILTRGLSILLILSKNQILVLLIVCINLLVSIWLVSALSLSISCFLLLLEIQDTIKTKSKNNKNRGELRSPAQRT